MFDLRPILRPDLAYKRGRCVFVKVRDFAGFRGISRDFAGCCTITGDLMGMYSAGLIIGMITMEIRWLSTRESDKATGLLEDSVSHSPSVTGKSYK